ncbi:MAG: 3',5'-cyclic-nucleotide phosphodiesterase [Gammaproteobacteria bacterium]|nr:3',5'-cyclic-nucleotide phosphodiesterase [Gammaproteobacteria bacterium]MDH5778226.1 3',5'-cyclic-nucleotide phosphodiesterase [Gammaproteobacteria bacterium]
MELRILGCSGGIGQELRTTTLLVNNNILIDAGTGLGDLSLDEMKSIQHVFITHSHLDHIGGLPLMIDSIFDHIKTPITIHAQQETIKAFQQHLFNNVIWPDFSLLPSQDKPVLRFEPMLAGSTYKIDGLTIEMVKVRHVVPAVGYIVEGPGGVFAFSGDTSTNDGFWAALNRYEKLDVLIVEAAFTNQDKLLSQKAGHYCPESLGEDIKKLNHKPKIYLSHHKPGSEKIIFEQCQQEITDQTIESLRGGQRFQL